MKVSTVDAMRELDRRAVTEFGIPDHLLMENAGLAVVRAMGGRWPAPGLRVVVLCGGGNNGGDGFVVARALRSEGAVVSVLLFADPDGFGGAAALHLEILRRGGGEVVVRPDLETVRIALGEADVVVDGLLGTGLTREVTGTIREVIEAVNASGRPVVAIDIPSGVDGDSGLVRGVAVRADLTVTFGLPKLGNLLEPGGSLGGELVLSHISFPPQLWAAPDLPVEIALPSRLPPRASEGHKGSFGDVLVVGGAAGYFGAPTFAAMAVLRSGAGYVRLAAPRSVVPYLATTAREAVFVPQPETAEGGLAMAAVEGLLELGRMVDFTIVGPGASTGPETAEAIRRLVAGLRSPVLVDGDGLSAVAAELDVVRHRAAPTVLTPHPGEMSRLTGRSVESIRSDPVATVRALAEDTGAVVVLKGARTLVGLPDGRVRLNPSGNHGMGTAGSGDVLTGAIAALNGLGLELGDAVVTGVFVHGLAGDIAAERIGPDGMTASDILAALPEAVRRLREDRDALVDDHYGLVGTV